MEYSQPSQLSGVTRSGEYSSATVTVLETKMDLAEYYSSAHGDVSPPRQKFKKASSRMMVNERSNWGRGGELEIPRGEGRM